MTASCLLMPCIALTLGGAVALAGAVPESATAPAAQTVEELWVEPADLERRNLFRGPSDGPPPPEPSTSFAFASRDTSGRSPGYDVRDPNGVTWRVKLGEEAQSEVVASRILWAIGFHQPPAYFLSNWTMTGQDAEPKPGGRFRPEIAGQKAVGEWK